MASLATLVTGLVIGAGGTWLFTRRRGAANAVIVETPAASATTDAPATKSRWQMPSFRRQQATVTSTPAVVTEETPAASNDIADAPVSA